MVFSPALSPSSGESTWASASVIASGPCQWYAVYTRARHEKQIACHFASRSIEHLLPLYHSVRQWKGRRGVVELPVFPGYVFVRLDLRDRLNVLTTPGVVNLVGGGGKPASIPDIEITNLHTCIGHQVPLEPHAYLIEGQQVLVSRGPLVGLRGVFLRRKSGSRLVLSVHLVQSSVALEVDESDIVPVSGPYCQSTFAA